MGTSGEPGAVVAKTRTTENTDLNTEDAEDTENYDCTFRVTKKLE